MLNWFYEKFYLFSPYQINELIFEIKKLYFK